MFLLTAPFGALGWQEGTGFHGDRTLVAAALAAASEGVPVHVTPTGPVLVAGVDDVESAWAAAWYVLHREYAARDLAGQRPRRVVEEGWAPTYDLPPGALG